jgi:LacI family transcriptional regulator
MGDGRRPTLRDVAARAGVSFKTVSRVVNDEPGVSPELTGRVREAIDELAFRPNVGARVLRRSDARTASIGLLLDDIANPFCASVARAVEDVVLPRGVVLFTASIDDDPERERRLTATFTARRADGLLVMPTGDDQSYLAAELRAGTAVVCVDREARGLDVDSVVATNAAGAAEGVRHLIAAGHTRIAYLGDRATIATARHRLAGYRTALAEAGVAPDPSLVVPGLSDPAEATHATAALLRRPDPPTALFTAQNMVTIGAIRALHHLGLRRLVAVVGFDDFPTADLLSPGVTVVAQDPAAIGRRAAGLLLARMAGEAGPPATHAVATVLVARGSGELPPPPR